MTAAAEKPAPKGLGNDLQKVADLLGGPRILSRRITSTLEAHELLLAGLPGSALTHFVSHLLFIQTDSLEKAFGMSLRTFQRRKGAPDKPLNQEQSGRTWKFAEILAKATDVFGSQEEAEQWLERPAIGLDQRRPIDLLTTPAGIELVEQYLTRLAYGVYA
ncbi:type II RES/Xre toxin-antitoxin system antitoxin [Bradyrhizobium sp. CCBAU 45389]|uniref:type II RES/Xre toxin-antitoxin system antitoxin n=1 Tax=Bradyrhizobium sp. CCBAU 45389 TaxID=858429 RepID=UPI002306781C|nr:antitoxin Xre/MbcA/ParS toxin-binding domain-containing protein [Bradyrhizobium sp. CCBAU 45389]MDA9405233.1 antitoxin [Bradyrhizobium sp. CCBAU 45389]